MAEAGDTVVIPEGNFLLTQGDILEEKDLTLQGAGADVTTIIPTGGGDALEDEGVTVDLATLTVAPAQELSEAEAAAEEESSTSDGIETKAQIIALIVTFGILLLRPRPRPPPPPLRALRDHLDDGRASPSSSSPSGRAASTPLPT